METLQTLSVGEALEQLKFPSFFEKDERRAAYEHVMLWGTPDDKVSAQIAKIKYPFDEVSEEEYSYNSDNNFPIVSNALSA